MSRPGAPADEVVRGLLQALQVDGRATFALIADVLGVSERTVERRYRELRAAGALRVIGRTHPERVGERQWLMRVGCVPAAAEGLAQAVARLPETSWVQLTSGGAEILCMVRVPADGPADGAQGRPSALSRLPRSTRVTRVEGLSILAVFAGGAISPLGKTGPLSAAAVRRIGAAAGPPPPGAGPDGDVAVLTDLDRALLAELARDGRARLRELAAATGRSASTLRRRIADLRRDGVLYFDVDVAPDVLGWRTEAGLWLTVHPAHLIAAGEMLATHPEVGFAAATTGTTNLYASLQLPDERALFTYLTGPVTRLPGLVAVQTAPVLRTVKQNVR